LGAAPGKVRAAAGCTPLLFVKSLFAHQFSARQALRLIIEALPNEVPIVFINKSIRYFTLKFRLFYPKLTLLETKT
jgi:hypothetical protein